MNKLLITTLFILTAGFIQAQKLKESEVPAAVKKIQAETFPGIKVEKWEKEGDLFEAEFHSNKVETSVLYDAAGALMSTETEIPVSDLPQTAKDYVKRALGGKTIKSASKIVDATGNINYEADVDNVDYIFDINGSFIKSETDKD